MIAKEIFKVAAILDNLTVKLAAAEDDVADKKEPQYKALKMYRPLLQKLVGSGKETKVEAIDKLKYIFDNKRVRKPDRYWMMALDRNDGPGRVGDLAEWIKQLNYIFRNNLPTARILKIVLDYGVEEGYQKLKQALENNQMKVRVLKEVEKGVETKWTKDKKKKASLLSNSNKMFDWREAEEAGEWVNKFTGKGFTVFQYDSEDDQILLFAIKGNIDALQKYIDLETNINFEMNKFKIVKPGEVF